MPTAVHFGGGNIGRGFIAELLHESGFEVIFVDVVDDLVNKINNTPSYKITEVGAEGTKTKEIKNYKAINSKHHFQAAVDAITSATIVTCAVGPNILKFIAKPISQGIVARTDEKPLAVIACENMINATDALREHIVAVTEEKDKDKITSKAEYGNSAIDRIVPTQPADANLDVLI
jgi:mannitol-1-phosphate 5-dehydrogenase